MHGGGRRVYSWLCIVHGSGVHGGGRCVFSWLCHVTAIVMCMSVRLCLLVRSRKLVLADLYLRLTGDVCTG